MKHYFQVQDSIITDAVQYPVEGYIEAELSETHLPAGINGGWYRWDGANYTFDEALKQIGDAEGTHIEKLRADVDYIAMETGVALDV